MPLLSNQQANSSTLTLARLPTHLLKENGNELGTRNL